MIDNIFRWRKERLLTERSKALADKKSFRDKMHALRDILESEDYFADLEETKSS
jgi:predicted ArsR family transcriptional regulator